MTDRSSGARLDDDIVEAIEEVGGSGGAGSVRRLSGGASRLTWSVSDAEGTPRWVVQQDRPGSQGAALPMGAQVGLLVAARAGGVPVPAVRAHGGDDGRGWVVLEHLPGESVPRRILRDPRLAPADGTLARHAGRAMAAVHAMDADDLSLRADDPLESMVALADLLGEPHPAFELGITWLREHRTVAHDPGRRDSVVVHGDFRLGNLLVVPGAITAVLDWELAHLGAPAEDLGWFCARAWRFGSPRHAGGVGDVADLLAGYAEGGGTPPGPEALRWWEAFAALRWGLICVLQASTHLSGRHRSVELATIGRRTAECEEDLLELVCGPSDEEPPEVPPLEQSSGPHDRPSAAELLDAVGEHLDGVREQLSGAAAFHLRVAANAVRMAEREVALHDELVARHRSRLERLGVASNEELATALRAGTLEVDSAVVAQLVRQAVRDKLAVSHPDYWRGDEPIVEGDRG